MTQPIGTVGTLLGDIATVKVEGYALRKGDKLYTASALEAAKQEGRREGLEEAARTSEAYPHGHELKIHIANAIRALIGKESRQT